MSNDQWEMIRFSKARLVNLYGWIIIPLVLRKTKLWKFVLGLLIAGVGSHLNYAQSPTERHDQIRGAIAAGNISVALKDLRSIRTSDPNLFAANNYDYLLGRLSEQTGEAAESSSSYQVVVARTSPLSQYALWHLAQLARLTGDLVLERERLRQLIMLAPTSLLREAATLRLGESFLESRDFDSAIAAIRPLTDSKNTSTIREALTLTGQAQLSAGRKQEARAIFQKVMMQTPDASRPDDFALTSAKALDSLDGVNPKSSEPYQLNEAEHLLRASIYQFNRDFDDARVHYLAVVENSPQSVTVPNATFQIGRGLYLQGRYEDALKYLQQALDRSTDSSTSQDALSAMASSYARLKRTDDAVAAYKRLIERFPDAPNPAASYLNIIDALHEAGRDQEALSWVQQARARFKNQTGSALALFAQARIHLAQASWQSLISDTNELEAFSDLGTRTPGGTTKSEIGFLRAFALEQLGKYDEAITAYLVVSDGRNEYYGRRATERLRALATDGRSANIVQARVASLRTQANTAIQTGQAEQARRLAGDAVRLTVDPSTTAELLQILKRAYDQLPAYRLPDFKPVGLGRREIATNVHIPEGLAEPTHQALGDELLFLGLYDEGVPEFQAGRNANAEKSAQPSGNGTKQNSQATDSDYTLALYSVRGGLPNRAVRFAEQVWKLIPSDYQISLAPREMVELLYPAPYRDALLKYATPRGVDPRLVLSIARQESRFQSDAKSVAAARGLMQFISATANQVAAELGRTDFRQDDLYNPDTAILFGSQHLSSLFKQFPGQPQAVAGAYNAGPDNLARWIARSRSDTPDRYVSEIGFAQTKDYVFKVMTNFWVYQELYDAQLQKR